TRQWPLTAQEDIRLAELAIAATPPLLSGALYHCEQAFEKALKAFLTWHGQPFQRTHDLSILVQLCQQIDQTFSALATDSALVTPYATEFRYPPVLVPPAESDATDALRATRATLACALSRLPPTTHP
ncbi:MAG: HEPN domain-containing protein, partial [Chloroflexi bacterium]|nr:HEPN domain-containing protein [Chloroflexota bacterium]